MTHPPVTHPPVTRPAARDYGLLWARMLRLSWRHSPRGTAAGLAAGVAGVAANAGIALFLKAVVNAVGQGLAVTAALSAVGAALAFAVAMISANLLAGIPARTADIVAMKDLHPGVYRDIAGIEGLEHLERTEVLDRLTILRYAGWIVSTSLWQALAALFTFLQLLVSLLLLGTVNPWLLFLVLFAAVPLWCDQQGVRAVADAETATAEAWRVQRELFHLGTRAASGKEIRVAGVAAEVADGQARAWAEAQSVRMRARVSAAWWKFAGWSVFAAGFACGLALVAWLAAHGQGTAGDVVLAVTVASGLRHSVQQTVGSGTEAMAARRVIDPYLWLQEYVRAERSRRRGGRPLPATLRDGLVFDHVTYSYPGVGRPALEDVSFRIPAGAVVAVVGEYGSGKTTLVKLVSKFYRPDSGRVLIDGLDLEQVDTQDLLRRSSAAFQDFGRFRIRLSESVGLGDLPHLADRERIARALADADAEALVGRLPDGLDTRLGPDLGGVDLSEGQWQRIALARSLMRRDPLLLILDEPTAALDAPSEHAIFEAQAVRARQLSSRTGAITLIVSHRFSTVTSADLILVMDRGRLVESGTHAELLAMDGQYAQFYRIQETAYTLGGTRA